MDFAIYKKEKEMKLHKKLGLVTVLASLMALVLVMGLSGTASATMGDPSCYCSQPALSLTLEKVYWGSYDDYIGRTLSVDYDIGNSSDLANAHNFRIVGTSDTEGVILAANGRTINMVSGGECELLTLKYNVPTGVARFNSQVYATTDDQCGNSYEYPGPMP
jgi:hypothetical protein